ncbi:hypothetical protein ACHQM5_027313 [Ranunculus cassubicifolius]
MAVPRKAFRFFTDHHHNSINPEPIFELDEADIFHSNVLSRSNSNSFSPSQKAIPISRKKSISRKIDNCGGYGRSLPLSIPDWSKITDKDSDEDGEQDEDDSDKMVPPHEYLLARQLRRTQIACSFSVHEGRGRTLKGRDLSRVRDAIWEQTGFED